MKKDVQKLAFTCKTSNLVSTINSDSVPIPLFPYLSISLFVVFSTYIYIYISDPNIHLRDRLRDLFYIYVIHVSLFLYLVVFYTHTTIWKGEEALILWFHTYDLSFK